MIQQRANASRRKLAKLDRKEQKRENQRLDQNRLYQRSESHLYPNIQIEGQGYSVDVCYLDTEIIGLVRHSKNFNVSDL